MKLKFYNKLKNIQIEHIFLIYILIQPFLDIYTNFVKEPFEILTVPINILINFIFAFVFILFYIKKIRHMNKQTWKKDVLLSAGYVIILFLYFILHYVNMQKFDDNIFNRQAYGFLKESYYIFRSYVLPIILLFTLYRLKINRKIIYWSVSMSVFILCIVIIMTNLFGVSLASYAENGTLTYIDGSIFHWPFFNGQDNFDLYTSKGWFHSANELSAILLWFSPIIIYLAFSDDKTKKKNIRIFHNLVLLMLIITMNMLGTRTASIGILIALISVWILFVFFGIWKKINIDWPKFMSRYFLSLVLCVVLFFYSPFYNKRYGEFKTTFQERPVEEEIEDIVSEDDHTLSKFIEDHYWNYYIQRELIELYPVNKDREFWIYLISRDLRLNSNYRIVKTDLYNRILERNDNPYDLYFGIGYNDILTNEKDYSMQIYYFGIAGVFILIGPFIMSILYSIYRMIKYKEKLFHLEIMILLLGSCISMVVPYLTGHIFGVVFSMNYIVLNLLLLLLSVNGGGKNEGKCNCTSL